MAVGKCKECGGQVSSSAKACPHCGAAPPKRTSVVTWVLGGIFGFYLISLIIGLATPETAEQVAAEAIRSAELVEENKRLDAIVAAKRSVQKQLKDPDSVRFGTVVYTKLGHVCGFVNAKNSYGAYSGDQAFMLAPAAIFAQMNDGSDSFKNNWNKHCGG